MNKSKKIYKKLIIVAIIIYVALTFINQQQSLSQYSEDIKKVSAQLQEEKNYKEQLAKEKEEVNSLPFIEQTAREKLDMYLPNERVYIDAGM